MAYFVKFQFTHVGVALSTLSSLLPIQHEHAISRKQCLAGTIALLLDAGHRCVRHLSNHLVMYRVQ